MIIGNITIISKVLRSMAKNKRKTEDFVHRLPGVPGFIDFVLLGDAHKLDCPDNCVLI